MMNKAVSFFRRHVKRKLAVIMAGTIIVSSVNYLTTNVYAEEEIVSEDFELQEEKEAKEVKEKKEVSSADLEDNKEQDSGENATNDVTEKKTSEEGSSAETESTGETATEEKIETDSLTGEKISTEEVTTEEVTTEEVTTEEILTEEMTTEEVTTEEAVTEEVLTEEVLTDEAAGIAVTLSYETGVFPENVTLRVTEVTDTSEVDAIKETVKDEVEDDKEAIVEEMVALDITVYDEADEAVEPNGEVKVTFENVKTYSDDDSKELKVFHMSDELDKATDMEKQLEVVSEDVAEVVTDGFSVYTFLPVQNSDAYKLVYDVVNNRFKIESAADLEAFAKIINHTDNANVAVQVGDTEPAIDLIGDQYKIVIKDDKSAVIAVIANNDGTEYFSTDVILVNDINLSGISNWTPIGTSTYQYSGTFDGNKKTISGMKIDITSRDGTVSNIGLFGCVNKSTIKDVTVAGNIDIEGNQISSIGGIVGSLAKGGSLTVENVTNSVAMKLSNARGDTSGVGGILGRAENCALISMKDCQNKAGIDAPKTGYIGGIAGKLKEIDEVTVDNCENTGVIAGLCRVGGMIGDLQNVKEATINNSRNNANISCTNYMIGGILASNNNSNTTITECDNGTTSSTRVQFTVNDGGNTGHDAQYIGGIVGQNFGSLVMKSCDNHGVMDLTGTTVGSGAAGILGASTSGTVEIDDCHNDGNVIGGGRGALGGIAGLISNTKATISHSSTSALIQGTGYAKDLDKSGVGGIVGAILNGADCEFSDITANGIVRANALAGGIVGIINSRSIENIAQASFEGITLHEIVAGENVAMDTARVINGRQLPYDRNTIKALAGFVGQSVMNLSNSACDVVLTETLSDGSIYELNYAGSTASSSSSILNNGSSVSGNYPAETNGVLTTNVVYALGNADAFGEDVVGGQTLNYANNALAGIYDNAGAQVGGLNISNVTFARADSSRSAYNTPYGNIYLPTGFSWVSGASDVNRANTAVFSANGENVDVNVVFLNNPATPPSDDDDGGGDSGGGDDGDDDPTPTANQVLGATRTVPIADENAALAATIPEEQVLGADRNPLTGDDTQTLPYIIGMLGAVALLGGWTVYNRKKKTK